MPHSEHEIVKIWTYGNAHKQGTVETDIYKTPAATDIAISNASCHPDEHKMAAFKNWIHRLNKLWLRQTELRNYTLSETLPKIMDTTNSK
jgi:hypothetical protein